MNNQIINNVSTKCINFTSLEEIIKFKGLTRTGQSKQIAELISPFIKIIDKKVIYYFSITKRLWLEINETQYNNFINDFIEETNKTIKIIKSNTDDDTTNKLLKKVIDELDNKNYIMDIIDRMYSRLYDANFITLTDNCKPYFPIKDGRKINLKTLEISERTCDDYFTFESNVEYLPDEIPNAEKFFKQIIPNELNREYLRKVLGYSITSETCARVFFIWYGHGSNGKSFIARLLELILQKQYNICDASIFIKQKSSKGQATPELMQLLNKRMSVYSEGDTSDNIEMNTAGLKQISGEDSLSGRALYKDQITFTPYTKLHMLTNFTPPLNAENALKQRLRYIFLDSKFVDNPDETKTNNFKKNTEFTQQLETIYLSEIFSWIAKGSAEFYKTMSIDMTKEFIDRTDRILSNEDSIKTFIDRKIIVTNDKKDVLKKLAVFEHYKTFCSSNSQRCQPRSSLFNRLEHDNIKLSVLDGYDVYRGIKINEDDVFMPLDQDIDDKDIEVKIDYEKLYKEQSQELADLKKQLEEMKRQNMPSSSETQSRLGSKASGKTSKAKSKSVSKLTIDFNEN